ncbi:MAG: TetR-like C-terminal domain-containing protein [Alsobacter sp.]
MPTLDRRAALRAALVDATRAIIRERGLQGVKARDVAAGAGCALGAIYQAFPDLDALVLAANEVTLEAIEAHLSAFACPDAAGLARPDDPPELLRFLTLAFGYLDFAAGHRALWRALFEHRMAHGGDVPREFSERLARLFLVVEDPLQGLRPELQDEDRARLARTLFSAVHGVVVLGLEEKLASLPAEALRLQLGLLVGALVRGLAAGPDAPRSHVSRAPRVPSRQRPSRKPTRR